MTLMRRAGALLAVAGLVTMLGAPALAQPGDQVCQGLDSGKIDVQDNVAEVTITAPAGQLIDAYCIKAGSANQGLGPEYVTLDPPVASITITHSSGKDVSHYSYSLVDVPVTTTTTVPPSTTTTTTTTSTSTTTTTTTSTTTTTTTTPPTSTTSTTVPESTTTTTVIVTTTTLPEDCDEDSPTWNEDTQDCRLPFTGPGDWVLPTTLTGAGLCAAGLALLALGRQEEQGGLAA